MEPHACRVGVGEADGDTVAVDLVALDVGGHVLPGNGVDVDEGVFVGGSLGLASLFAAKSDAHEADAGVVVYPVGTRADVCVDGDVVG